jgi:REase_MTES_1575/AAA domain
MVVVGDRRQLPPTTFFTKTVMDEEADDEGDDAPQFESILEASSDVVSELLLNRHYRSRDERLIAFSNAEIYRGGLRTFPGPGGPSPIGHHVVPSPTVAVDGTRSNPREVEVVVDRVLDHARDRPGLSLGVITMGQAHAHNIELALRRRLGAIGSEELDAWFGARRVEPFFVKNLERVQGDERDVVILTTGYHKTPDGELPHTFGPLLRSGGERRLNVAITRSRVALEVVTSFAAGDMRPERSDAPAVDLLRRFLASLEAEEPGSQDESTGDAVIADIGRHLEQAGVPTRVGYGRSGYRIGIAARHPDDLTRFVLAIEVDDETYRAEPTVRDRDRVVGESLERLGWRVHRIWVDDWMRDPRGETRRAVESWVEAVIASDDPAQPRVEDGV